MSTHAIKPIRTEDDHSVAIEEIAVLWNAKPGTPEHDRLEVLGVLVDAYERVHCPTPPFEGHLESYANECIRLRKLPS